MKSVERTRQSLPTPVLAREVMEHQHALAEAVGAHLEAGAVGGERVAADGPGAGLLVAGSSSWLWVLRHRVRRSRRPPRTSSRRCRSGAVGQKARPLPCVVQQRHAVAVADALEVAVGRAARVVRGRRGCARGPGSDRRRRHPPPCTRRRWRCPCRRGSRRSAS